ncbi:MAG TPA: type VI secretion system contractile sheath large subunit [Bryobacteraceae bacterium]|jgi:type VI secretion system protein ImpC|nr:type VI secretion system contractile sheath large subunit [Bryobacteraceae bacterium]
MPERPTRASVHLDVEAGRQTVLAEPEADTPFQILILGDFSGRTNRSVPPFVGRRRLRQVDADNLDQVLEEMGVSLELPQVTLQFRALEDFHPDRIYESTEAFAKLAEARSRPAPAPPPPPSAAPKSHQDLGRGVLESMLEQEEETEEATYNLPAFIEKVTAGHLVEREDPRKKQWAARVDSVAAQLMRAILHDPHFQALEASWRAVWMLIQRLQPDTELKIFLFDATLEELTADPAWMEKHLVNPRAPWAAIVGNFSFGQTAEDAARLKTMGKFAAAVGAPFLAETQPPAEEDSASPWRMLRRSPESAWIGLAVPRFLLRLPYGKNTYPVEAFDFEEMPASVHTEYLWGNPAFACACLLGQAFREDGWQLRLGQYSQLDELPLHVYDQDGESQSKPCAEVLLTESDTEFLLDQGLMPLAAVRDQGAAILVRFQSIAEPLARLAGRWG